MNIKIIDIAPTKKKGKVKATYKVNGMLRGAIVSAKEPKKGVIAAESGKK